MSIVVCTAKVGYDITVEERGLDTLRCRLQDVYIATSEIR